MIERALLDYYRCPAEFVQMTLGGELSPASGYFWFGSNLCYGQSSHELPASIDDADDLLPLLTTAGSVLRVPFDPSQVVDNFRLERYGANAPGLDALRQTFWQRPYYFL